MSNQQPQKHGCNHSPSGGIRLTKHDDDSVILGVWKKTHLLMGTNVTVVTGTRAEYGILRIAMEKIDHSSDLSLSVIVTGMHLSSKYGYTLEEVRDDGFEIDHTVEMLIDSDSGVGMAKSLGIGLSGLAEAFNNIDSEMVLVLGDRGEALAAGIAAAHMDIPVAHIHGGDMMKGATIDDSIRHALTKFAHIHFPGSEQSAERIRKLGEEDWRIHPVGALALDEIIYEQYTDADTVYEQYQIPSEEPLLLIVQHPMTVSAGNAGQQMCETIAAVDEFNGTKVIIYPNADSGGEKVIDIIDNYADNSDVKVFENLPREDYLGILAVSDVMIGNSSSGIVEAPSLGVPVVDIGRRQKGRERADHTLSVPHDREAIANAIKDCLTDSRIQERARSCENPYDLSGAGDRIVSYLEDIELNEKILQKKLTY